MIIDHLLHADDEADDHLLHAYDKADDQLLNADDEADDHLPSMLMMKLMIVSSMLITFSILMIDRPKN